MKYILFFLMVINTLFCSCAVYKNNTLFLTYKTTVKFIDLNTGKSILVPSFLFKNKNIIIIYKKDIDDCINLFEDYQIKIDGKTVRSKSVDNPYEEEGEVNPCVRLFFLTQDQFDYRDKFIKVISFCNKRKDNLYGFNKSNQPYWPIIEYN